MAKKGTHIVNPRFAKGRGYDKVIATIAGRGRCPFCPDNFRYHKKPILHKSRGWFITESTWPYKNSQKHLLIIALRHKEQLRQLTTRDMAAVLYLAKWGVKKFNIKGGGLTIRFGDTNFTGATVAHIHAHLIYPKANKKGVAETVNFPIG